MRWLLGNLTLKLPVITMRCWYHYYFKGDKKLNEEQGTTPGRVEIQETVETRVGLMIPFFVCLFICFLMCHSLTCCQLKLGKLWALSCYPLSWCCIDLVWGILSRSHMGATGFQFCLYYQTHDSQIALPLCSHAFLSLEPVITVQIGLHAVLWSSF